MARKKNILHDNVDEAPVADEELERMEEAETPVDWLEILSVLWNSRKLIAAVTGSVTVLSIIISLSLPESYKSTATLLPETEKSKLASLGGLSDLAALTGVSVGGEVSLVKLYPTIIKSGAVLKNVLYTKYQTKKFKDSIDLIQFWNIEGESNEHKYQAALNLLRDGLGVLLDAKTGVVSVSIETSEPQLSADIVNNVTKELDIFIRTKRTFNASEQRKFIEGRLVEVKADLEKAENRLKEFREKNRRISDSPQLLLQQERLIREVQINTTVYTELKKQYEVIKIEEVKNLPIINVLDKARAAAHRERPKRTMLVATWCVMSLLVALAFVVGQHRYGQDVIDFVSKIRTITK